MKVLLIIILGLLLIHPFLPAKIATNNRNRNPLHWPSYYNYYGYPIVDSVYYYSFPSNSNFFDSYPSTYTNWTYPSYPYVGKYYVNDAPVPASKMAPRRYLQRRSVDAAPSVIISTPQEGTARGVFIGE